MFIVIYVVIRIFIIIIYIDITTISINMIQTIVIVEKSEAIYYDTDDTQSIENRYNESGSKKDHVLIFEAPVLKIIGQQKEIKISYFPSLFEGFLSYCFIDPIGF